MKDKRIRRMAIVIAIVAVAIVLTLSGELMFSSLGVPLVKPPVQSGMNLPEGFWAPLAYPERDEAGEPVEVLYAAGDLGRAPADQEQNEYHYFFYPGGIRLKSPLDESCEVVANFACPEEVDNPATEQDWQDSRCRAKIPAGVMGAWPLVPGKYTLTCGSFTKAVTLTRGADLLVSIP